MNFNGADFHVHSDFSDSSYSVEETLKKAKVLGIGAMSFTDHDHTETYAYARPLAQALGIALIPGVELSAYDFKRGRKVHLLGYHYREEAPHIRALGQEVLESRNRTSHQQLEKILAAGYPLDREALRPARNQEKTLYKQHIMRALGQVEGESPAYRALYKRLFKPGGLAYKEAHYVDVHRALEAILADGGLAVLAHPGQLDSFDLAEDLVREGLGGIEVYHYAHSPQDEARARALARDHGLLVTGGSDYHGTFGKNPQLGAPKLREEEIQALVFKKR
ncbi:MAG: PHP domain-containing protein [Tissierellia bacterium]|nr:PHP domain-containing protein [Tissierellia bacterium]